MPRHPEPSERVVGARPVLEALRARRRRILRLVWRRGGRGPSEAVKRAIDLARDAAVPVEALDARAFEERSAGAARTQGLLLEAGPLPVLSLQTMPEAFSEARCLVALDGVEDPHNLGAVARVAVAAGADGLVLPKRRSAPLGEVASRSSAGALEHLPVAVVPNLREALARLADRGFERIGADPEAEHSVFETDFSAETPFVFLLGSEHDGIRKHLRQSMDRMVRIPMNPAIGSLNLSTAAAVILFEWRRRTQGGK